MTEYVFYNPRDGYDAVALFLGSVEGIELTPDTLCADCDGEMKVGSLLAVNPDDTLEHVRCSVSACEDCASGRFWISETHNDTIRNVEDWQLYCLLNCAWHPLPDINTDT